jgi:hypothetical protein
VFELTILTESAAFKPAYLPELARILREAAENLDKGIVNGNLHDKNGERVGRFVLDAGDQ